MSDKERICVMNSCGLVNEILQSCNEDFFLYYRGAFTFASLYLNGEKWIYIIVPSKKEPNVCNEAQRTVRSQSNQSLIEIMVYISPFLRCLLSHHYGQKIWETLLHIFFHFSLMGNIKYKTKICLYII